MNHWREENDTGNRGNSKATLRRLTFFQKEPRVRGTPQFVDSAEQKSLAVLPLTLLRQRDAQWTQGGSGSFGNGWIENTAEKCDKIGIPV